MFLDATRYPYLKKLADHSAQISDELQAALHNNSQVKAALLTNMAMDFPSNQWTWDNAINTAAVGYDLREGNYTMMSLYKTGHDLDVAQIAFPKTLDLLQSVAGIEYACISALGPKAHLGLHSHSRQHHIFHLLLNDLTGGYCEIFCDGKRHEIAIVGDTALFDYSLPHESISYADNIRFNLMVDFSPN